jgi:5'-nucleotidase
VTPAILLTNDDGIDAPGIAVLREALEGLGEIATIAPERNNSAVARGITIHRPLRLRDHRFGRHWRGISCDGTPSDCVRVGLLAVENPMPDLVVSGINLGANMGADVTYSGTVGAALEAALRGLPAIAFSVESLTPRWLGEAVPVVRALCARVLEHGLPRHAILNVNLPDRPADRFAGVKPVRLGGASCHDKVLLEGTGGVPSAHDVPCDVPGSAAWADTDFEAVTQGYVAVTPIRYDLLDAGLLAELASWDLDLPRLQAGIP